MENVNQLSIFDYLDYRDYFKDYYHTRKNNSKAFSLQVFAKKVNQSRMSIKYLIDKKRHISNNNIGTFSKIFFSSLPHTKMI